MPKILKLEYKNPKTHVKSTGRIEIKNQTAASADLFFYGDICSSTWDAWQQEDKCPQDVADFLNGLVGVQNINIYINSGGGDSFAGLAIYNILKRNPATKEVHVDGVAASAASAIAMIGAQPGNALYLPPGAQLMIHDCWTIAMGNANYFKTIIVPFMEKTDQAYVDIYVLSAVEGTTPEQIKKMMDAEKWMNGTEAALLFNNVQVQGEQIAARLSGAFISRYKNVPQALIKEEEEPAPDVNEDIPDDAQIKISKAKLALACEM